MSVLTYHDYTSEPERYFRPGDEDTPSLYKEMCPYCKASCFRDGVTDANIDTCESWDLAVCRTCGWWLCKEALSVSAMQSRMRDVAMSAILREFSVEDPESPT